MPQAIFFIEYLFVLHETEKTNIFEIESALINDTKINIEKCLSFDQSLLIQGIRHEKYVNTMNFPHGRL